MPNETDHPQQTVKPGQVHGYVGVAAAPPAVPLLPAQSRLVWELDGSGAPVDGTSGTGAGQAGIGSRYTDITAGQLYLNGGTKASPVWKLVTRAA